MVIRSKNLSGSIPSDVISKLSFTLTNRRLHPKKHLYFFLVINRHAKSAPVSTIFGNNANVKYYLVTRTMRKYKVVNVLSHTLKTVICIFNVYSKNNFFWHLAHTITISTIFLSKQASKFAFKQIPDRPLLNFSSSKSFDLWISGTQKRRSTNFEAVKL